MTTAGRRGDGRGAPSGEELGRRLDDLAAYARSTLDSVGLGEWSFGFDRARTRFGACHYRSRRITLSRPLALRNDEDHSRRTILHEVAHALVGPGHAHDEAWTTTAQRLGIADPRPTCAGNAVPPRWLGECPAGHAITRHRLDRRLHRASCARCAPDRYDPAARFRWRRIG